jgi:hypothetical protein
MIRPRTLADQVSALKDFGATPDLLAGTKIELVVTDGQHHAARCSRDNGSRARPVSVLRTKGLCRCLDEALGEAPSSSRARLLHDVLEVLDKSTRLSLSHSSSPVGLTQAFRDLGNLFKDLPKPRGDHDADSLLELTRQSLVSSYEGVKAEVRSEGNRAELHALLKGDPGPDVLVSLEGYRKPHRANLTDALVASYWSFMPRPGFFVLECPRSVADHLSGHLTVTSVLRRKRSDDDSVVETAAGLWLPDSADVLGDFAKAVQAARAL